MRGYIVYPFYLANNIFFTIVAVSCTEIVKYVLMCACYSSHRIKMLYPLIFYGDDLYTFITEDALKHGTRS